VTGKPAPFVFEPTGEAKRFAPATERNRDAIVKVLREHLPANGIVLEIASGTGEHIVHFAAAFPQLLWQPSDYDEAGLASIAAWSAESGCKNILPPVRIDASASNWPVGSVAAMLCINMIHIAPWEAAKGLFAGAGHILAAGSPLYLYGPFREANVITAESNEAFDASLKLRNPAWGLRHLDDIAALAEQNHFMLDRRIDMPANNLSLVFRKK
jgi:hypothetical protein